MNIIGWLIFGGLVGWIASKIIQTNGQQGIMLNISTGVVGAVLGGLVWRLLTQDPDPAQFWSVGNWVTAFVGASLLLWLMNFIRTSPERNSFNA